MRQVKPDVGSGSSHRSPALTQWTITLRKKRPFIIIIVIFIVRIARTRWMEVAENTCTVFLVEIWIDGEQGYDDDGRLGGPLNMFYLDPCWDCECSVEQGGLEAIT